jgi:uncharacterized protein (UPF0276 family)
MTFIDRVVELPRLGVGVSTEYGAFNASDGLDIGRLRRDYPQFSSFLEIGVEVVKGLDSDSEQWLASGYPCTYHFLDLNLDEPTDFDERWLTAVEQLIAKMRPAWMCGDAGLWHFGARERGHMLLLPPILSSECATAMAEGIARLRARLGLEVLPENPPGRVFLGDLHILDFYAQVCDEADTGQLLDCAHLALYQRQMGYGPLDGLDGFPLDRVVELHVAGGRLETHGDFEFVDDDHSVNVLPETWAIFEHVVSRCPNLKAVVFECERNGVEACLPGFDRIRAGLNDHPSFGEMP